MCHRCESRKVDFSPFVDQIKRGQHDYLEVETQGMNIGLYIRQKEDRSGLGKAISQVQMINLLRHIVRFKRICIITKLMSFRRTEPMYLVKI
ncbi:hypothetical protein G1E_02775 [Pseudomonas sp. TJI-51]|jgi:hypothetical protein|nr:hypothetical protein G1E_02775 [Pseudomonas sp. TJI-51]RRV62244.1 hypothetical protein EGJ15_18925 [Pseudomonas sp. p99-361]